MLNLKELVRLREVIDYSMDCHEYDIIEIRNKITDMITLRRAWGQHKRIEIEKEDCY